MATLPTDRELAPGALDLIIKATRLCNLRCTYCHDWRAGPGNTMQPSVLEAMVSQALQSKTRSCHVDLARWWSQTLLRSAFFEDALQYQAFYRLPGQIVVNKIQTNATHLTDEWLAFLRAHEFRVGVSLDGPRALHDSTRVFAGGRGSFDAVRSGLRALRDNGIRFGLELVVSRRIIDFGARRLAEEFNDLGVRSLQTIACKPSNRELRSRHALDTSTFVTPTEYVEFLIALDIETNRPGAPRLEIRDIEALKKKIRNERAGVCTLGGNCFGRYFSVEPDGDVAHCDLFLDDDSYTVGNVTDESFSFAGASLRLEDIRTQNASAVERLKSCPGFSVCSGWCPHERYVSGFLGPKNTTCCGLSPLIKHLRTRIDQPDACVEPSRSA